VNDDANAMLIYQKVVHCAVIDITRGPSDQTETVRLASEMDGLCCQIEYDEEVRVTVLGFDGLMNEQAWRDIDQYGTGGRPSLVKPVAKLRQPVIAAIRGDAIGLGLELALACDIRIAGKGARFGFHQISAGFLPSEGGTQRLPRLIGRGRAMEMILTGEMIDASEACRVGLVTSVVDPDGVMTAAKELAQDMAKKSPLSLSYAKEALCAGVDLTLDQGLQKEMDLYLLLCTTRDRVEGITSFKQKRKPRFQGN
jgi:enoyl-CoA hydratase/carnithine racemase